MSTSDKNIKRFKRAVKSLNSVIEDIKKEDSKIYFYLDGSQTFCMMDGTKNIGEEGDDETILADAHLNAYGGDW